MVFLASSFCWSCDQRAVGVVMWPNVSRGGRVTTVYNGHVTKGQSGWSRDRMSVVVVMWPLCTMVTWSFYLFSGHVVFLAASLVMWPMVTRLLAKGHVTIFSKVAVMWPLLIWSCDRKSRWPCDQIGHVTENWSRDRKNGPLTVGWLGDAITNLLGFSTAKLTLTPNINWRDWN